MAVVVVVSLALAGLLMGVMVEWYRHVMLLRALLPRKVRAGGRALRPDARLSREAAARARSVGWRGACMARRGA